VTVILVKLNTLIYYHFVIPQTEALTTMFLAVTVRNYAHL